jgi:hypothetical protein
MRPWLWVTRDDTMAPVDGYPDAWTCHEDTLDGDVALLYWTTPFQNIRHVFKVRSDAYYDSQLKAEFAPEYTCDVAVVGEFREPITIADMRADATLVRWPALQVGFQGRLRPDLQARMGSAARSSLTHVV